MTTVLLVRHGESAWNEQGRVQGWAPVGLTDAGRREAAAVARRLRDRDDVDGVVTSDLRRARETAEVVADALGEVTLRESPGWRERDFGALQGFPSESLLDRFPEFDLLEGEDAASERPRGGESWRDVRRRVLGAFEADARAGETVAVVTHFAPILLVLGAVRDEDLTTALTERRVATGSITELRRVEGTWTVAGTDRRPGERME